MILISDNLGAAISLGIMFLVIAYFAWDMYKRRTGYSKKDIQWEKLEAKTTGATRIGEKTASSKVRGSRGVVAKYTEYAIKYEVDGEIYVKWFNLYPGIDYGDVFGEGTSVLIKYNIDDQAEFEVIKVLGDR